MMLLMVLTICSMVAATANVHAVRKPSCATKDFSQRRLKYGNLERKAGNFGKLSFKVDPNEVLHIYFRIHPRRVDNPGEGYDAYDVPSASSLSLAQSLDALDDEMRNRTTVSVFLNSGNAMELHALKNWTSALFHNRSLFVMTYECPLGNSESYACMVQTLFQHHEEGIVEADDIVYFVEDDYLHQLRATRELVDIFSSHDPCFALPYDFADRYFMSDFNDDDGHITLIAGRDRIWRTTMSTTVTFSARFATLHYFFSVGMVPHPKDDYFASLAIAKSGATILSPIPSLSTHIEYYGNYLDDGSNLLDNSHEEYVSLYHDWFEEGRRFVHHAKEMEWNLWSLTDHYSATAAGEENI